MISQNPSSDETDRLLREVQAAITHREPVRLVGGDTKSFYLNYGSARPLSVAGHVGIVDYQPSELVITARAGTPLRLIKALLADQGQMLPFEPPSFGDKATLGGVVASGLSGPRRPYAGSVRDHVLGVRFIDGRGELLRMGGTVMKNVAGFDVSRLLAGSLGTLGLMLDISVRVLPKPDAEITLAWPCLLADAPDRMSEIAGRCLPVTAMGWVDGRVFLRLSGTAASLDECRAELGGEYVNEALRFWEDLRELRAGILAGDKPLWRLSLPPASPHPEWLEPVWLDWGGGQRWVSDEFEPMKVFDWVKAQRGHALVFRRGDNGVRWMQPMDTALLALNRRIKDAFDPLGIFASRSLFPES